MSPAVGRPVGAAAVRALRRGRGGDGAGTGWAGAGPGAGLGAPGPVGQPDSAVRAILTITSTMATSR